MFACSWLDNIGTNNQHYYANGNRDQSFQLISYNSIDVSKRPMGNPPTIPHKVFLVTPGGLSTHGNHHPDEVHHLLSFNFGLDWPKTSNSLYCVHRSGCNHLSRDCLESVEE
ncbi:hypothetical protein PHET_10331 [Paragonimus heterotremus]|uniref:Uncharacterized protein n=1 Tax=Paragonimus heterotremus TaxID=100268 RepID=A0A8J4T271_9TREM|nr:hypothetical protein PHET_10331 [Paragonimus heterotremus]